MRDLSGHVALVTGGNGGIGLGMAKGLARAGVAIAIWGRDETKNATAAGELALAAPGAPASAAVALRRGGGGFAAWASPPGGRCAGVWSVRPGVTDLTGCQVGG